MKNLLLSVIMILTFGLQPQQMLTIQPAAMIEYYSPVSGARYIPARTTLAFRFAQKLDAAALAKISVRAQGAASGNHPGTLILSDDKRTVIFKPDAPYTPSELVQVDVYQSIAAVLTPSLLSFSFTISSQSSPFVQPFDLSAELPVLPQPSLSSISPASPHAPYLTTPPDFPAIDVTTPANGTDDGDMFLSNFKFTGDAAHNYLLILDNQGEPVYYQKVPNGSYSTDFKKLPNGNIAYFDQASGTNIIMDDTYHVVDTIHPGNGYPQVDLHELLQFPNGHLMFLIYDTQTVDMSAITPGGNPQASVTGAIIQELDMQKNVVFQWRSWDHFAITDTNQSLTAAAIDYVHANALDLDASGNILLSSRHMDEITKINRQTGDIIWRLGGKHNQFTFGLAGSIAGTEPPNFYFQHNIRVLPNGDLSLFDNHNGQMPQVSRGLEYTLNTNAMTATLENVIHASPDVFSSAMGNVQHLPNGNIFIGWGANFSPNLTEFKPDGSKAIELTVGGSFYTYRAFRFPWHGYPTWAPTLLALSDGSGGINLTVSWNGATDVASYKVFDNASQPITQQSKTGFETTIHLAGAQAASCVFRVMPINLLGENTQFSNVAYNPACSIYYMPLIAAQ